MKKAGRPVPGSGDSVLGSGVAVLGTGLRTLKVGCYWGADNQLESILSTLHELQVFRRDNGNHGNPFAFDNILIVPK